MRAEDVTNRDKSKDPSQYKTVTGLPSILKSGQLKINDLTFLG